VTVTEHIRGCACIEVVFEMFEHQARQGSRCPTAGAVLRCRGRPEAPRSRRGRAGAELRHRAPTGTWRRAERSEAQVPLLSPPTPLPCPDVGNVSTSALFGGWPSTCASRSLLFTRCWCRTERIWNSVAARRFSPDAAHSAGHPPSPHPDAHQRSQLTTLRSSTRGAACEAAPLDASLSVLAIKQGRGGAAAPRPRQPPHARSPAT
jgi:hypothetical protein